MTGALLLAAWCLVGVVLAATGRVGAERSLPWVLGGAVLGPLWLFITLDQPAADDQWHHRRRRRARDGV